MVVGSDWELGLGSWELGAVPLVMPLASQVAEWVSQARYEDLPPDVVASTKLRILDVIGLALAGAETAFGRSTTSPSSARPGNSSR